VLAVVSTSTFAPNIPTANSAIPSIDVTHFFISPFTAGRSHSFSVFAIIPSMLEFSGMWNIRTSSAKLWLLKLGSLSTRDRGRNDLLGM
jgi:hypothetical protein